MVTLLTATGVPRHPCLVKSLTWHTGTCRWHRWWLDALPMLLVLAISCSLLSVPTRPEQPWNYTSWNFCFWSLRVLWLAGCWAGWPNAPAAA